MAQFRNLHKDYREYEVVDVYEGEVHIATINLHDFAITLQSQLPEGQMNVTPNYDWPESVIIKWKNSQKGDKNKT